LYTVFFFLAGRSVSQDLDLRLSLAGMNSIELLTGGGGCFLGSGGGLYTSSATALDLQLRERARTHAVAIAG
jgi:hypothetical protein